MNPQGNHSFQSHYTVIFNFEMHISNNLHIFEFWCCFRFLSFYVCKCFQTKHSKKASRSCSLSVSRLVLNLLKCLFCTYSNIMCCCHINLCYFPSPIAFCSTSCVRIHLKDSHSLPHSEEYSWSQISAYYQQVTCYIGAGIS